jgi:hypothetical protein
MIIKIIIEIALAFITMIASNLFWQIIRRKQFLIAALHDEPFLKGFFAQIDLDRPKPDLELYVQQIPGGYAMNLKLVIQSDEVTQRRPRMFMTVVLILIFTASYYILGGLYLVINLLIFSLFSLCKLSKSTYGNAFEHIVTVALIIHRWHLMNPSHCKLFIERAWALRPLYNAITSNQTALTATPDLSIESQITHV